MDVGDRVKVDWELGEREAEITGFFPERDKIAILMDDGNEIQVPADTVHPLDD